MKSAAQPERPVSSANRPLANPGSDSSKQRAVVSSLRVAIDAQIISGLEGGAEQYLIGLTHGLGQLEGDGHRYDVVTANRDVRWIESHLGANTSIVPAPPPSPLWQDRLPSFVRRPLGIARRGLRRLLKGPPPKRPLQVPASDGLYESLGPDVLHITYPSHFVTTSIPIVYTVHDLQHRHLPEYFDEDSLKWREFTYPAAFEGSEAIIAISRWVRDDLVFQYRVPPEKIFAIPSASPGDAYRPVTPEALKQVQKKLDLPESFLLYPARTYAHKNHIRLIEAIALLRDRDNVRLNLICTGAQHFHWPFIKKRVRELKLESQVRFLGFIGSDELRCLFHLADMLVFPSLFEGAGIPLLEAFGEGTAVVCSDIPPFREYGADAPLYFDPRSVDEMAGMLRRTSSDKELLSKLRNKSRQRGLLYSWEKSAAMYRAVYRKVGGVSLTPEDQLLLQQCQQ
jgi:glycosyltransferase involved in cell wall biosynthesis